ncbi:MAG: HIT family protein [Candidatus Lokiarchaeota archaeon]|nr:HIT family protein [Candidatus Lokiarchaeota archaeon]
MSIENCIFCQIVKKKIPAKIVFEDDYNVAFLDIFPVSSGHTIVIPKKHFMHLEDIPIKDLANIIQTVKKVATLIHNKLDIDGYNILQNNFKAAGQVIDHFHFHIIPRRMDDNKFKLYIPREQANDQSLEDMIEILRK